MSDFSDLSRPDASELDQSESNNFVTEGFETLDPVGSDAYESQGTIPEQDEEVTTTNVFGGEEPAEEDRYTAGALDNEAKPSVDHAQLISWGDEEDEQPAAAVPDSQASALDDLGFDMGVLASAGAPQSTPAQDPFSNPPTESQREAVSSTEPVSETPQETKVAGQWMKNIDPRVLELIYWRDVRKTGVVFGSMMLVLLSLACFSLMSVLAYLSLAVLTVTLSFRLYKNVMAAVQKTNDGHPFKQYLELDISLKDERMARVMQTVLQHVNRSLVELRRLFLIEDLVDSIKFGLLLWVLTYIGAWFNGMTLIILLVVGVFSLPKVYETYKVQIDNYVNMATTQLNTILAQVQSKVPFLKKKTKAQ